MNDSMHEFDPELEARFRGVHTHIPDEPFVGATLQRVAAERAHSAAMRRVLKAAALVAVLAVSPWLIEGSVLLSDVLDRGLTLASEWLATPVGMATGAIAGVVLAVLYRMRARRAGR